MFLLKYFMSMWEIVNTFKNINRRNLYNENRRDIAIVGSSNIQMHYFDGYPAVPHLIRCWNHLWPNIFSGYLNRNFFYPLRLWLKWSVLDPGDCGFSLLIRWWSLKTCFLAACGLFSHGITSLPLSCLVH